MRPEAPQANDETTAVLVDDHDLFRGGLAQILADQGVRVVGEASDGERAVDLVAELAPDVAVMDLNMPGIGGVEATRRIATASPATRVLVLTISSDDDSITQALLAGASGYVVKDASVDELALAVRAAARGSTWLSPRIAGRLLAWLEEGPRSRAVSDRELAALRLLADGKDDSQIAAELFVTEGTVRNRVAGLLMKLQLESRLASRSA